MYFAHGYSETETRRHLLALCRDHALVYAVLPDTYKDVSAGIPGYSVSGITILPTELFKGSVSKHFVAILTPEEHKTIATRMVLLETIDRRSFRAPESLWAATTLNTEDFAAQQTVRALFHQALTKKENVKEYSRPQAYAFSPELTLWYSGTTNKSGNRWVCLYLCEVPTEQQKKRNKYPRGKKIASTETWNTDIPEEQIGSWIEERGVYNEKLRSKAVEQLERYKGRPMSLKSLWYCLYERMSFSDEEAQKIKNLLRNETAVGLVIGAVSEEEIEASIASTGENPDEMIPLLDTLFDAAIRRKLIKTHPFEVLRAARKKQKRREESIRALAKRSYTEAEEARIFEYFQQNQGAGGCLGMLLCFLTGLTPPYVAALTWRDWRRITHTSHTQLVANKKLLPDGSLEWQTEEDNCRLLPLMDVLSEVLAAWNQKNTPEPDDRIVTVDGNPLQAIRKQIREAETFAGIAPDLISIPDSDKRMDLNQYAGSRMRENFERYCYVDCAMTDAEVHYLILRRMPDTLSRNYADYGHECMQERMSVKLNQWGQRFRESRADDWRSLALTKQPVTLTSAGNRTESYHLTAHITEKLTIAAECDHDFDYRFLIRCED